MPRRKPFKVPKLTVPPTRYEVWWIDANHENDYDGPADEFESELVLLPHIGYHTKTEKDHIVLSSEYDVADGVVHIRDNMTVPRVHIRDMKVLRTEEEFRAADEEGRKDQVEHDQGVRPEEG